MRAWFKEYQARQTGKRQLRELGRELDRNLENFYVAQQLGQLRVFQMGQWSLLNSDPRVPFPPEIQNYGRRMNEFNSLLQAAADFEKWYSADIDRQDQKNARRLHELKEAAQENFSGLESLIKSAQNALNRGMGTPDSRIPG